ncbi:MAG: hypothetical protein KAW92_01010, partial [Candidatus Cloacimonetes bacterium]|nr:hypothetical protein [Candidatus Cloacimonadota bacterium]
EAETVGISNLNFGSTDAANITPVDHPIVASQNSYGKYIDGAFSGSFTRIDNIKFWKASGSYVTGETCQFSGSVSYAQPVATDYGDPAVPTSEPANPNVGISGDVDGHIDGPCNDGSSCNTDHMRVQLLTTAATPGGSVNQKTFCLQYDEQ